MATQRKLPAEGKFLAGMPGTIYVLSNEAFRPGIYRIGATRRSGTAKAMELNRDRDSQFPGRFECVFQIHTPDCLVTLNFIRQAFRSTSRSTKNEDFYEIDLPEFEQKLRAVIEQLNRRSMRCPTPSEFVCMNVDAYTKLPCANQDEFSGDDAQQNWWQKTLRFFGADPVTA